MMIEIRWGVLPHGGPLQYPTLRRQTQCFTRSQQDSFDGHLGTYEPTFNIGNQAANHQQINQYEKFGCKYMPSYCSLGFSHKRVSTVTWLYQKIFVSGVVFCMQSSLKPYLRRPHRPTYFIAGNVRYRPWHHVVSTNARAPFLRND